MYAVREFHLFLETLCKDWTRQVFRLIQALSAGRSAASKTEKEYVIRDDVHQTVQLRFH